LYTPSVASENHATQAFGVYAKILAPVAVMISFVTEVGSLTKSRVVATPVK
jgi:hypothetical protein